MTRALKLISWVTLIAFLPASLPLQAFAADPVTQAADFDHPATIESQQPEINRLADQLAEALASVAIIDERIEALGAAISHQSAAEANATAEELVLLNSAREEALTAARSGANVIRENYLNRGTLVFRDGSSLREDTKRLHTANIYNLILGRYFTPLAGITATTGAAIATNIAAHADPQLLTTHLMSPFGLVCLGLVFIGGATPAVTSLMALREGSAILSATITQAQVFAALRTRLIERGITVPEVLTPQWIRTASEKGFFYATILHDHQRLNLEITNLRSVLSVLETSLSDRQLPTQAGWARTLLEKVPTNLGRTKNSRAITNWAESAAPKFLAVRSAVLQTLLQAQVLGIPAHLATQALTTLSQTQAFNGVASIDAPDFRFHQHLRISTELGHNTMDHSVTQSLHTSLQSPELLRLLEALSAEGKKLSIHITDHPKNVTEGERASLHLPGLHAFNVAFRIYDPSLPSDAAPSFNADSRMVVFGNQSIEKLVLSSDFREALRPILKNFATTAIASTYQHALCNAHLTLAPAQRVRVDTGAGDASAPAQHQAPQQEVEAARQVVPRAREGSR